MKSTVILACILALATNLLFAAASYANKITINFTAVIDSIEDFYMYIGDDDIKKGDAVGIPTAPSPNAWV